jgi:hypothetical protein
LRFSQLFLFRSKKCIKIPLKISSYKPHLQSENSILQKSTQAFWHPCVEK